MVSLLDHLRAEWQACSMWSKCECVCRRQLPSANSSSVPLVQLRLMVGEQIVDCRAFHQVVPVRALWVALRQCGGGGHLWCKAKTASPRELTMCFYFFKYASDWGISFFTGGLPLYWVFWGAMWERFNIFCIRMTIWDKADTARCIFIITKRNWCMKSGSPHFQGDLHIMAFHYRGIYYLIPRVKSPFRNKCKALYTLHLWLT